MEHGDRVVGAVSLFEPRAVESLPTIGSGRASDVHDEPLLEFAARAPDLDEIVAVLAEAVRVAMGAASRLAPSMGGKWLRRDR